MRTYASSATHTQFTTEKREWGKSHINLPTGSKGPLLHYPEGQFSLRTQSLQHVQNELPDHYSRVFAIVKSSGPLRKTYSTACPGSPCPIFSESAPVHFTLEGSVSSTYSLRPDCVLGTPDSAEGKETFSSSPSGCHLLTPSLKCGRGTIRK